MTDLRDGSGRQTRPQLTNRVLRAAVAASLAASFAACDRPSIPAAPSPQVPVPVSYALTGYVSGRTATGSEWLSGALVSEEASGRSTLTDSEGFYRLTGLTRPSTAITATRAGYNSLRRAIDVSESAQIDLEMISIAAQVLHGVVFERAGSGLVPLRGVSVYCDSCGSPEGHTFAETDANGRYSFSWAADGAMPLFVRKDGYRLAVDPEDISGGRIVATVKGDTQFDVEMVRR